MARYIRLIAVTLLVLAVGLGGCGKRTPPERGGVAEQRPGAVAESPQAAGEHAQQMEAAREASGRAQEGLSGKLVDGVREVRVEAFRYGFKPDPIVVKKGEKVRIIAKSTDVAHGFGVRDLGLKLELQPGREKTVEFTPEKAGDFRVACTVYCGPGHEDMHATLRVIE